MMTRTSSRRLSGVMVLLAVAGLPSLAIGQSGFKLTRVDENRLVAGAPVSALYWDEDAAVLHAGTLAGLARTWSVDFENGPPAQPPPIRELQQFQAHRLSTLVVSGGGHDLLPAGFARGPRVAFLPGDNIGRFARQNVRGVFPHEKSERLALVSPEGIHVLDKDAAEQQLTTSAAIRLVAWIDAPGAPPSTRLAAYDSTAGRIRIWNAADFTLAPRIVDLPRLPPETAGGEWQPLPLSVITAATENGGFVTGDAQGLLRSWDTDVDSRTDDLPEAYRAVFSADATWLLEQTEEKLFLRKTADTTVSSQATRKGRSTSLRHREVGGTQFAAVAWPVNDAGKFDVELHQIGSAPLLLKPDLVPTGELKALAIGHDAKQVAGGAGPQGVIFFGPDPLMPPPAPTPGVTPDTAIVELSYSSDSKWLIAVGNQISLYNAASRKLLASRPLGLPAKACEIVSIDDPQGGNPPASCYLLLGTSTGQVVLLRAQISSSMPPTITVQQLAEAQVAQDEITSVFQLDDRAVVGTGTDCGTWRIDLAQSPPRRLVPLERFPIAAAARAIAFPSDRQVAVRLAKSLVRQTTSARQLLGVSDRPVLQLQNRGTLIIAADATGRIFQTDGLTNPVAVPNADKVTALGLSRAGTTLAAGVVKADGQRLVRLWQVASGQSRDLPFRMGEVTALLFGKDDRSLVVGDAQGRLFGIQLGDAAPSDQQVRLAKARGAVQSLAWLPKFGAGSLDFDRLLAADGLTLGMRALGQLPGPRLQADASVQPQPSLWYASAFAPGQTSMALANAEGQVWGSPWPLPRPLVKYAQDPADLNLLLVGGNAPATKPLYALAWSTRFSGGAPTLFAAGADGQLYQFVNPPWRSTPAPNADQAIYALSPHPEKAVLALGHGPGGTSGSPGQWLSMWPATLDKDKVRFWPVHQTPVRAVAFSQDGKRLASIDRNRLLMWDCSSITDDNVGPPAEAPTNYSFTGAQPISLVWLGPSDHPCVAVGLSDGRIELVRVER